MKAIVRDDIISLSSFVEAEFKYKKYLEVLMYSGNYCFLDQFKRLVPNGQSIVKGMLENNLIATESVNKNYKYIYLTDTAMKYLYLKDSEDDFSDIKKNRISVKKVVKNPTEKQLLSSAYKFHMLINDDELIKKDSIVNDLRDRFYKQRFKKDYNWMISWSESVNKFINKTQEEINELNSRIDFLKNSIATMTQDINLLSIANEELKLKKLKSELLNIEKLIDEENHKLVKLNINKLQLQKAKFEGEINILEANINLSKTVTNRYNDVCKEIRQTIVSKESEIKKHKDNLIKANTIIETEIEPKLEKAKGAFQNLYDISKIIVRIVDNTLEFIILDTGNFKTSYGYLKQINELLELEFKFENIKIVICSYAEHRADNLYNEFIKAKHERNKAFETMKSYDDKVKKVVSGSKKPDFYVSAEKVYNNTPDFEVLINSNFYYMGKYKEVVSNASKAIKRKDVKSIDELMKKLKQEIVI